MDMQEFEDRILGNTIDLSLRHKEIDNKAILFRVAKMPFRDTLMRIGNEVNPLEGEYPCYLQAEGSDAIDIGYLDVTLDKVSTCLRVLRHTSPKAYWVEGGVIDAEVTTEELVGTIKFSKGGDIGEYI